MAKKINEMTSDDLMTLPDDIEGIVLDVQGRQKQYRDGRNKMPPLYRGRRKSQLPNRLQG